MNQNVRWKLLVILGVIALSVWSFYYRGLDLGLGLRFERRHEPLPGRREGGPVGGN